MMDLLSKIPEIGSMEIHERYRQLAREYLADRALILKADAYNEASGGMRSLEDTPLGGDGTVYLEYDAGIVATAKRKYPGKVIIRGDIRYPPFRSGTFDAVADFSTLDHVPPEQMVQTIREYARCLKPRGQFILTLWCDPVGRGTTDSKQYHWPGGLDSLWRAVLPVFPVSLWLTWLGQRDGFYMAELVADKWTS